jgi:hypothetical protein
MNENPRVLRVTEDAYQESFGKFGDITDYSSHASYLGQVFDVVRDKLGAYSGLCNMGIVNCNVKLRGLSS